jgi:alpha-amylase
MAAVANATYSSKDHNYTMVLDTASIVCTTMLNEDIQLQIFEWYTEGGGNHWKAIKELTPQLSDFGITAMWIPRTF